MSHPFNRLTAIDAYTRHRNSAACYQLAQSVLKIGSALAERVGQGEVGGCTALADSAWQLLQLAIERVWSALDGPFFCFLVQTTALADSVWRLLHWLAIERAWSALDGPFSAFLYKRA